MARVTWSAQAEQDLDELFDWLFQTYIDLGEDQDEAFARVTSRVEAVHRDIGTLAKMPFQGTLCDDLLPGLRRVTKDRVIVYFVPDEASETLFVLAIFFGGQDHLTPIRRRFATNPDPS